MDQFLQVVRALDAAGARFVLIGVWGANYYAESSAGLFTTHDRDLFIPPEPETFLTAWEVCAGLDMVLWSGVERLDSRRDLALARTLVERRAAVTAIGSNDLQVDLTVQMAGFEFEEVWRERRIFLANGVEVPVARLEHIVRSKTICDRPKDRMFLSSHRAYLEELMARHRDD